jgi:ATP phosphoribosyltransferase
MLAFDTLYRCAIPKGRIYDELAPIFAQAGIEPEPAFFDQNSRALSFATNIKNFEIIRVRSFDVATFVAYGAAQIGICGLDVIEEHGYPELYMPLDLGIGGCHLSLAAPESACQSANALDDLETARHIRVATKYPNITQRYFADRGIQAECIHLNGAMELAPIVGLSDWIVDLVSSGATLKANGLEELQTMLEITARVIVNRTAYKTRLRESKALLDALKQARDA